MQRVSVRKFPIVVSAVLLAAFFVVDLAAQGPASETKNGARSVAASSAQPSFSASPSISTSIAPLSKDDVVDNLIRRNQERAHALARSEATRVYHLAYRGVAGNRDAEMTVEATYESPATKNFKVVSESGSKILLTHVFKKLLEGEQEAAEPEVAARTKLDRDNYDFQLVGFQPLDHGGEYLLQVTPKSPSKFVYQGKIWVDAVDFAVTRIQAEPAQSPSFWTKKSEIRHEYRKFGDFWLPVKNESTSYIRLGGLATLTIEYRDYRVTDARTMQASNVTH